MEGSKKNTRHKWPALVLKNTLLCQQMTIFVFDPYLWGSLGPPETLGFLGLLELPWASPWAPLGAQDQKKNSRDIHVSHAQNTVNYSLFGV